MLVSVTSKYWEDLFLMTYEERVAIREERYQILMEEMEDRKQRLERKKSSI